MPANRTAPPRTPSGPGPTDLTLVVGDRPSTDGALARQLGVPFALVLSGVTDADGVPSDPAPDAVAADLAGLVHAALDEQAR